MNRVAAFIAAAASCRSRFRRHLFGQAGRRPSRKPRSSARTSAGPAAADACRGSTEASRPLILCQDLAKRAGRIESFAADGRALSAEQLAKCNSAAKDGAFRRLRRPIKLPEPRRTRVAPSGRFGDLPDRPFFSRLRSVMPLAHIGPVLRQYELVEKIRAYDPDADEALINRAYVFSMKAHGAQVRASGDPYFSHPIEVAGILTDLKLDDETIVTAILHDTIEDTVATPGADREAVRGQRRPAGRRGHQALEDRGAVGE